MTSEYWRGRKPAMPSELGEPLLFPFDVFYAGKGIVYDELMRIMSRSRALDQSIRAYRDELNHISALRKRNGRCMFSGIGFYPEMGPDCMAAEAVSGNGHLISACLHEGELLAAQMLSQDLGGSFRDAIGRFIQSIKIRRDLSDSGQTHVGVAVQPNKMWRARYGSDEIGRLIGEDDWMRWGRLHRWENMTFIPSVSGDFTALDSVLQGCKIDFLILKGVQGWRFRAQEGVPPGETPLGRLVRRLDERYLSEDAVVLVSFMDRQAIPVLEERGYDRIFETPERQYPEVSPIAKLTRECDRDFLGPTLLRSLTNLFFMPRGQFTVLEKTV